MYLGGRENRDGKTIVSESERFFHSIVGRHEQWRVPLVLHGTKQNVPACAFAHGVTLVVSRGSSTFLRTIFEVQFMHKNVW